MASDDEFVERIMRRGALAIGDGPPDQDGDQHRDRIVTTVEYALKKPRRRLSVGGIAILAALAGAVILLWQTTRSSSSFWTGSPPTPGREGDVIDASTRYPLPVTFADTSRLELSRGARAKIVAARSNQVEALLETGEVKADFQRESRTAWLIVAGPFHLRTAGTAFTVEWQPSTGALRVDVRRGTVVVTDTEQDHRSYEVAAGKRLQIGSPKK